MRAIAWFAVPLLGTLMVACSGPGSQAPPPSPTKILADAGQATSTVRSVTADVKFSGAKVQVQGLTLTSASSKLRLPGDSDTTFKVQQGDIPIDLRVVTTGGRIFIRLPFSPFVELTGQQASEIPDVCQLFDAGTGLRALLRGGASSSYQASEQVGAVDCYTVAPTHAAALVGGLFGGRLTPQGDVHAVAWAGRSDHLVRRTVLSGKLTSAGVTKVEVDLHDFNRPVVITAPTT